MHSDLVEMGWTEEQWSRIGAAISEEAQKARVAAQVLSLTGPLDPTTVAVPSYALSAIDSPPQGHSWTERRLSVNSDPTLHLSKILVNVYLHSREAADPELQAALTMFRRAANYVARIEDALVFYGKPAGDEPPRFGLGKIPHVYRVLGGGAVEGLFTLDPLGERTKIEVAKLGAGSLGNRVVSAIVRAIDELDSSGQLGPYACVLSPALFEAICTPNDSLVLPRDRILPFLQGPLLRSSALASPTGIVIALSASPIELVVASDIHLKYLQTTEQPRLAFEVSERVALRIKESAAIALLT